MRPGRSVVFTTRNVASPPRPPSQTDARTPPAPRSMGRMLLAVFSSSTASGSSSAASCRCRHVLLPQAQRVEVAFRIEEVEYRPPVLRHAEGLRECAFKGRGLGLEL